jgi:exodeoxyribonuclease-3
VVGDLNVAPLENDVWNHKALLRRLLRLLVRKLVAAPKAETGSTSRASLCRRRKNFIPVELSPPDWALADKGRRLTIWVTPALGDRISAIKITKARGWTRPSDHVPVTATIET